MATFTVAAVQAAYVLMDRDATIERVAALTAEAAANGAKLVVFPEAFVPGDPIWKDAGRHLGRRRGLVLDARRPGGRRAQRGDRAAGSDRPEARR